MSPVTSTGPALPPGEDTRRAQADFEEAGRSEPLPGVAAPPPPPEPADDAGGDDGPVAGP